MWNTGPQNTSVRKTAATARSGNNKIFKEFTKKKSTTLLSASYWEIFGGEAGGAYKA